MHATIAAFSAGVPCIPYAYSRKFSGLYNTFGFYDVLDARDVTLDEACEKLQASYLKRAEIKQVIAECKPEVIRLGNDYLNNLKSIITGCL